MPSVFNEPAPRSSSQPLGMSTFNLERQADDHDDDAQLAIYPVHILDAKLYLRNDRQRPSVGFGSIKISVGGRDISINNLQVMRDQNTGAFTIRVPRKESADKRVGATWSTVGDLLVKAGIEATLPEWLTNQSVIVPPADADLEDTTKPWISYWQDINGTLCDDIVRFAASLCSQCDTCKHLTPHDPAAFTALVVKKELLERQISAVSDLVSTTALQIAGDEQPEILDPNTNEPIENFEEWLEKMDVKLEKVNKDVMNALFTCKVNRKLSVTPVGLIDCETYTPSMQKPSPQSIESQETTSDDVDYRQTEDIPI